MNIKSITKYEYKGVEYKSLLDIREKIHDTIGLEVLDVINRTCPLQKHKDYNKLLDLLCSKKIRKVLLECLNVNYTYIDDFNEENITVNILDIK